MTTRCACGRPKKPAKTIKLAQPAKSAKSADPSKQATQLKVAKAAMRAAQAKLTPAVPKTPRQPSSGRVAKIAKLDKDLLRGLFDKFVALEESRKQSQANLAALVLEESNIAQEIVKSTKTRGPFQYGAQLYSIRGVTGRPYTIAAVEGSKNAIIPLD